MIFANFARYIEDAERVQEVRPAHRAYMNMLYDQGKVFVAGPFMDGAGAILVYEAETIEEADQFFREDPYMQEGIITTYEIHPWTVLGLNAALFSTAP